MVVRSASVAAFSALCWLAPAPAYAVEICVVADVRLPAFELGSTVDATIGSVRHCPPRPVPPKPSPPILVPPVPGPPEPVPPGTAPSAPGAPLPSRPVSQRPVPHVSTGRPATVPEALAVAPVQLAAAPPANLAGPPCPQPAPAPVPAQPPPSAVPEHAIAASRQDEVQAERRWAVAVLVVVIGASIAIRRIFRDPSP